MGGGEGRPLSVEPIPGPRREGVRAAWERLSEARGVILTTHVNPDGDGIGSEVALLELVEAAGGRGVIVNPNRPPAHLDFLMPDASRVLDAGGREAREQCRGADLLLVVDTGERSRIGRVEKLVRHLPVLVIDHHPAGREGFEGHHLTDTAAAATGELVFDLLTHAGGPWSPAVVDGLYVALMTDTGSFRFSNTSARVHRIAAELIERGAAPERLHQNVYGRVPLRRIRLLEAVLPTLELSPDGSVAWMTVPGEAFRGLGCTTDDLEGLVDYPRELEGVEVALLFRELDRGGVKVSLRSTGEVDVNRVASLLGGGGHVKASGVLASGELEAVRERVVALTAEAVRASAAGARRGTGDPET